MRAVTAAALVLAVTALLPGQSDTDLEGPRLRRFLRSKGASEAGRSVHWRIAAPVFHRPHRRRRGYDLYVHKGIGLVIASRSADLLEIRRRGGTASVRGRVFRVPPKHRGDDDPEWAIDIREIRRRR